jgi:mycofactocin precursor
MENDTTSTVGSATATLTEVEEIVADDLLVEDELLVEEISIDGMCGVY